MDKLTAYFDRINNSEIGRYFTLDRFVSRNGRFFTPAPFTGERMAKKNCFQNAVMLGQINAGKGYRYCEGIAFSIIPTLHAWCADAEGRVVDPTWDEPENCEYFGLSFDPFDAFEIMKGTGVYGLFDTGRGLNIELMKELDPTFEPGQ